MKDYNLIWENWLVALGKDSKATKDFLDSLNLETKKGIDVIIQIAFDEIMTQSSSNKLNIDDDLKKFLSFCTVAGYLLYISENKIDVIKENYVTNEKINQLGNLWMQNYEKDQFKSILNDIDPNISLLLNNFANEEFSKLTSSNAKLLEILYKDALIIESFLNWSSHQGYILGFLESKLINK